MEKTIEQYFVKMVKQKLKGVALKLNSLSMTGLPDRIILLPKGRVFFAEIKDTGKKATSLQLAVHDILRSLDFRVYVIDSKKQVEEVVLQEWTLNLTITKKWH